MATIQVACVIDDDPLYNFGVRKLFEFTGFSDQYLFYNNGLEAIKGLLELQGTAAFPKLILLDINMPLMNGWEFLEEYERLSFPKDIRIYVVSSSINQEEIDKANAYSFVNGYIFKPLTLEKIKALQQSLTAN